MKEAPAHLNCVRRVVPFYVTYCDSSHGGFYDSIVNTSSQHVTVFLSELNSALKPALNLLVEFVGIGSKSIIDIHGSVMNNKYLIYITN